MPDKKVFVTVGTTKFDDLIKTVLSPHVLRALASRGYNDLTLQIGNSQLVPDCTPRCGFERIDYFRLSPSIREHVKSADLVISHAGAGSILEALEDRKDLIVVTNELLMHNHQQELADELHVRKHLYYCTCSNLHNVVQAMDMTKLRPYAVDKSKSIANFIDEVMGFS